MSIIKELKKEMEYDETIKQCKTCKHSKERENPYLDRDWFWVCLFNNIKEFPVESTAHCNKWESKI